MALAHSTEILSSRFSVFDEDNKGMLDPYELANALRSLGWTDINATHSYNLMQKFFATKAAAEGAQEKNRASDEDDEESAGENVVSEEEEGPATCESIDLEQFLALVRQVELKPDSPLECYTAYTLFDKTKAGIISTEDLTAIALALHGNALSERQRERLVNGILMVADSNNDGKLALPEFRNGAAAGGVGTENGPLDLGVLVVDQPSKSEVDERKRRNQNSTKFGGNNSATSQTNGSFSSNHRRSRRGSETISVPYPHSNVLFTVPGAEDANAAATTTAEDANEDDQIGEQQPDSTTVNFAGIDVTFTDGMIGKDQVAQFFHECGDLLVGADFDRWFEVEDADGDGFLTEEQFRNTLDIFLSDDVDE